MSYTCKRCKYTFPLKETLIKHLKKANPCYINNIDIDRDEYLKELEFDKKKENAQVYIL